MRRAGGAAVALLALLAATGSSLAAQEGKTPQLTLEEAIARAEASSPALRQAANDLELNRVERQSTWATEVLPRLRLDLLETGYNGRLTRVNTDFFGNPIENPDAEFAYFSGTRQGLGLSWTLQGRSLLNRLDAHRATVEEREVGLAAARHALRTRVRRAFFDALQQEALLDVERELARVFGFRHRRLLHDLTLHAGFGGAPRRTVAITGASGLIGSELLHFLTSGGHRVLRLVRSRDAARADDAVYWSVAEQEIDAEGLAAADSVVHLAGEPLVQLPRWTEEKKRRILDSRVKGTELLSRTLAGLHRGGPGVLVSASGITYYGGRGDEVLTEESGPGKGFLADVCQAWEAATRRAEGAGLRVVRSRTGPVMSPAGGMLERILPPFKMGVGGRIGSGRQYVAWIDMDDVVGVLHHALMDRELRGPVNAVSPNPVPNAAFVDTLARVVHRPSLVPVPAFALKAALGQMGKETILDGQRARPARITAAGYRFLVEDLEDSLSHQLGRQET
ncbi:MAG: TIGR01777 family oxidoreductase [Gemmatimonadetes bacterium]|nr:TIGR01777 family oxidoreductase [Gemmatimonadota bacterium]